MSEFLLVVVVWWWWWWCLSGVLALFKPCDLSTQKMLSCDWLQCFQYNKTDPQSREVSVHPNFSTPNFVVTPLLFNSPPAPKSIFDVKFF